MLIFINSNSDQLLKEYLKNICIYLYIVQKFFKIKFFCTVRANIHYNPKTLLLV